MNLHITLGHLYLTFYQGFGYAKWLFESIRYVVFVVVAVIVVVVVARGHGASNILKSFCYEFNAFCVQCTHCTYNMLQLYFSLYLGTQSKLWNIG